MFMLKHMNLDTHNGHIRTSKGGRLTWEVGPCRRYFPGCCVGDDVHNLSKAVEIDFEHNKGAISHGWLDRLFDW